MARKAKSPVTDIGHVRIPSQLHECLCSFFGELKLRVLEAAARRAAARTTDGLAVVMNEEDVLEAAGASLATAFTDLEVAVKPCETAHARQPS